MPWRSEHTMTMNQIEGTSSLLSASQIQTRKTRVTYSSHMLLQLLSVFLHRLYFREENKQGYEICIVISEKQILFHGDKKAVVSRNVFTQRELHLKHKTSEVIKHVLDSN